MKTKLLVIVGLLVIAFAATVAPVMGATSATTLISGNPNASLSIATSGNITNMPLSVGPNADADVNLIISANIPFSIGARDLMDSLKPAGSEGKMSEVVLATGNYVTNSPKILGTAMDIDVSTTASIIAADITLTASDQPIYTYTGSSGFSGQALPLNFKQTVLFTDPRLTTADHAYRIPVQFTIQATA